MSFLEELLKGGPSHTASVSQNSVSLKPKGDDRADLESFQHTVDDVVRHEGEGYTIYTTHVGKDRPGDLIDLVMLRLED
jgi:hypothetical protein